MFLESRNLLYKPLSAQRRQLLWELKERQIKKQCHQSRSVQMIIKYLYSISKAVLNTGQWEWRTLARITVRSTIYGRYILPWGFQAMSVKRKCQKLWKKEVESKISKNFQAANSSLHKLMQHSSELFKFDQPFFYSFAFIPLTLKIGFQIHSFQLPALSRKAESSHFYQKKKKRIQLNDSENSKKYFLDK